MISVYQGVHLSTAIYKAKSRLPGGDDKPCSLSRWKVGIYLICIKMASLSASVFREWPVSS